MVSKVIPSSVRQIFAKVNELPRVSKISLAAFGILIVGLVVVAIRHKYFLGVGGALEVKVADVYVRLTGNPTHMGHMHMIALGVNRLVKQGYGISKVTVILSTDEQVTQKVGGDNLLKKATDITKVVISKPDRIQFLNAAIKKAKEDGIFNTNLSVVHGDSYQLQKGHRLFLICGSDYANDPTVFTREKVSHAVIVSRKEEMLKDSTELDTDSCSRLIVLNEEKTNAYSSSKIQNGDYQLLPEAVRDMFGKLHEAAQSKEGSIVSHVVNVPEEIECEIAKQTYIAIQNQCYITPSGKEKHLSSGAELLQRSRNVPNSLLQCAVSPRYKECEVIVVEQDCLYAAEAELSMNGAKKVAVLMLASPIEPGGAMNEGNNGQEEDLCRRSDIFGLMWDQSHGTETPLYNLVDVKKAHQKNPDYPSMKNNRIIHVPLVTVFRSGKTDHYQMLEEPFKVGMLVSPGLDRPGYEQVEEKMRYERPEDEEQLRKLIMTQLKVAYDEGYESVILGAFGCGAFWNPPELIAEFYKTIIDTYFKNAFKKIVFAILEDKKEKHNPRGNLKPFQECFGI